MIKNNHSWLPAIALSIASAFVGSAQASVIFDFNGIAGGTPFTLTNGGISATFSAPGDPGSFLVYQAAFSFGGSSLLAPVNGKTNEVLEITFSVPISSFSAYFGTDSVGPAGTLELVALSGGLGGSVVGTTSAIGIVPRGYTFPEGTISFDGGNFDTLIISDSNDPHFALGSFSVSPVPVPAAAWLFGSGLLGLTGLAHKRKSV